MVICEKGFGKILNAIVWVFNVRGGVHTMIFKVCQALDIILKEKEIQ